MVVDFLTNVLQNAARRFVFRNLHATQGESLPLRHRLFQEHPRRSQVRHQTPPSILGFSSWPRQRMRRTALATAVGYISRSRQQGGKLWRWKYRFVGREKLMSFGSYPDVPLSLARERHREARKLLATGTDPMAQRKAANAAAENSSEGFFANSTARWPATLSTRDSSRIT